MPRSRPSSAPWCEDDSDSLAEKISVLTDQLQRHPKLASFIHKAAIMTVVDTLKYEVTWPSILSEDVLQDVLGAIWDGAAVEIPSVMWDAEGDNTNVEEARKQVSQSMLTLKYLWEIPSAHRLTEGNIKEAHALLMANAISDGEPMNAGTYRSKPCHATGTIGGKDFYSPGEIVSSMENLVADLAKSTPSAATAAKFCYRFLAIHPFSNGNGRLARFLVAWIMRSAGMPFPISIGQGKNARKHWLKAVTRNDSLRGLDWLETLILESCLNRWINFSLEVNMQLDMEEEKDSSGCSFLNMFAVCMRY
jgi:Fic family protein